MNLRNLLAAASVAACTTMAIGASYTYDPQKDYSFPSSSPPANQPVSSVQQFVSFIFDDNGYTGAKGTIYECDTDRTPTGDNSWSKIPHVDSTTTNPWDLNLKEGDLGISWAVKTLASKTNYDGTPIHLTFNMITGLQIPTWGPSWQDRQSKFGSYVDPSQPYVADQSGFLHIADAWGREQQIGTAQGGVDVQAGWVVPAWKAILAAGHEIGNHTIDHMESNSPLPNTSLGFGRWNGEGFDPGPDSGANGLSEQQLFDLPSNAWALTNGWALMAGMKLSVNAWKGAIDLGEEQLTDASLLGMSAGNIYSFRAPRLETNSNQFYALKASHYQYDCGLEEGYDNVMSGANAWWPYTTDNGTPNGFIQKQTGEVINFDSMPAGVWEIPVNCMVVPPALRAQIYTKHRQINNGSIDGDPSLKNNDSAAVDSAEWCGTGPTAGKVTAFDFNMFILWGMSKDEWVQTMAYNLHLRMNAGKAPLQFGCHTDYYTPIYDNATLQNALNLPGYGLVITKKWNTYKDRQLALEAFRDTCIAAHAKIVCGHELIEAIKGYQAKDSVGKPFTFPDNAWSPTSASITGSVVSGVLTGSENLVENIDESFQAVVADSSFGSIDHMSLSYHTNTALKVQFEVGDSGDVFEALLTNTLTDANSGKIPISSFRMAEGNKISTFDAKQVKAIHITPQWMGKDTVANFTVSNITVYGDSIPHLIIPIVKTAVKTGVFAVNRLTTGFLNFSVPVAGAYNVEILSLNGRVVHSEKCSLKPGASSISLGNRLAPSMYIVRIKGANREITTKVAVTGSI